MNGNLARSVLLILAGVNVLMGVWELTRAEWYFAVADLAFAVALYAVVRVDYLRERDTPPTVFVIDHVTHLITGPFTGVAPAREYIDERAGHVDEEMRGGRFSVVVPSLPQVKIP